VRWTSARFDHDEPALMLTSRRCRDVTPPHADAGPVSGVYTAAEPFPVRIDLDPLV